MDIEMVGLIVKRITQVLGFGCLFAGIYFFSYNKSWAKRLSAVLDKWHSTDKITNALESTIDIEAYLAKQNKILSVVAFILGLILCYLAVRF